MWCNPHYRVKTIYNQEGPFDMNFYPINMRTNYMKSEYAVVENQTPLFLWGAVSSEENAKQVSYRIVVSLGDECFWDSGEVLSENQSAEYAGKTLASGAKYQWTLTLKDNLGKTSLSGKGYFKTACFDEWQGQWVESPDEKEY